MRAVHFLVTKNGNKYTATVAAEHDQMSATSRTDYLSDVLSDRPALTNSRCLGVKMLRSRHNLYRAGGSRALLAMSYQQL